MVELDAKLTADGTVICFHDSDLQRTTNASGAVADNPWSTIQTLDAGSWFGPAFAGEPVPLLQDALALIRDLGMAVNVEIKPNEGQAVETASAAVAVVRAVYGAEAPERVIYSSFWPLSIQTALDRAPEVARAYLAHRFGDADANSAILDRAEALHCTGFNPNGNAVPEALVRQAKLRGFVVATYTINDVAKAQELRSWGVDAIITDDPALMIQAGV